MTEKQTVYLPTNNVSSMFVTEEGRVMDNVKEQEGYFFTPEQLNEYIANVIKKALETAAEKVCVITCDVDGSDTCDIDIQSIKDTFDQIYKLFGV